MEFTVIFLLLVLILLFYYLQEYTQRYAVAGTWLLVGCLIILGAGILQEGITSTYAVAQSPSSQMCLQTTNCSNGVNSSCNISSSCSQSFNTSAQVQVIKKDDQTVAVAIILWIAALYFALKSGMELLGSLGKKKVTGEEE